MRKHLITLLILVFFMLLLICHGCGKQEAFKDINFNDVELLSARNVVKLLKENDVPLTKVENFPIELSSCKIYDESPQPYLSNKTGVYYMFYEYDGYSESSDLVGKIPFYEYPDCEKEFSNSIIPGSSYIGKNLYICIWYPELNSLTEDSSKIKKEKFEDIIKEMSRVSKFLGEKCFDKRRVTLTGKSDNWDIKIPIDYIYNQRKNKNDINEVVFYSKSETLIKYLNKEKEEPNIKSISWYTTTSKESRCTEQNDSLLARKGEDGFYILSNGLSNFNPKFESSIIVNIICRNGESEEITCKIP